MTTTGSDLNSTHLPMLEVWRWLDSDAAHRRPRLQDLAVAIKHRVQETDAKELGERLHRDHLLFWTIDRMRLEEFEELLCCVVRRYSK